jgi:hypothetical protein
MIFLLWILDACRLLATISGASNQCYLSRQDRRSCQKEAIEQKL